MGVMVFVQKKMTLLIIISVIGLCGFTTQAVAKNSFLIAPGRLIIDLSNPKTVSYIITNTGDEKIRLSIKPVYFPVNSRSLAAGEPLDLATSMDDDIHKLIRVSPRKLSLRPGQRRDIRVSIRPRPGMKPGDYRAHLLVSMLEASNHLKNKSTAEKKSKSVGMKLILKMETAVAIYGTLGEQNPQLEFECLLDKKKMVLAAINTSPWRFDGWINIYKSKKGVKRGKSLSKFRLNSIRMSKRYVKTKWKPQGKGPYILTWTDLNAKKPRGTSTCSISGKYINRK